MYNKSARVQAHRSKERIASSNLLARPEHLSVKPVEQIESLEYRYQQHYAKPTTFYTGIADDVARQSYFQWMNAVYVNPKSPDLHNNPKCISIYAHHTSEGIICFSGYHVFMRQDGHHVGNNSIAKVTIRLESETDSSLSYVSLLSINGIGQHRLGSVFVQLAIEYSIQNGGDGRVSLRSINDSGQFYFKLGFMPDCEHVYDTLLTGQDTNGSDMYLPEESISIWKEKISQYPLLSRQVKKQRTESMNLHSDDPPKFWPFLIDRLHLNAIRALSFDYASYYTQKPQVSTKDLIQALKVNSSLEYVMLKDTIMPWLLSEMIDALSSHPKLLHLTLRNYDEGSGYMDEFSWRALARLITHSPQLKRLSLAYLTICSNSFVIFCEALANASVIRTISFYNMTLSQENVSALRKSLLRNITIEEIHSSQCDNNLEAMLVEVRRQRSHVSMISEVPLHNHP